MKKNLSLIFSAALCAVFISGCGETSSPAVTAPVSPQTVYTVVSRDTEDTSSAVSSADTVTSEVFSEVTDDIAPSETDTSLPVTEKEYITLQRMPSSGGKNNSDPEEDVSINTVEISVYSKSADVSRRAKQIVSEMSDEEKASQLILARCPQSDAAEMMSQYNFGGYTLYAVDLESRDTVSASEFIGDIKASSKITPFIAVDEEGGNIVRVSKFSQFRDTPFLSPGEIFSEGGADALYSDAEEKADLLLSIGINLNLAPVADVASEGDYIFPRTVSDDYTQAGEGVTAIINGAGSRGLISCLKHFPGYGSNVDTHTGISNDKRSLDEFRNNDFIPFEMGLSADYTPAVMVNHNIIECVDPDLPASLSPEIHKILREELGFDGVIITDDLGMDGIKAYSGSVSPYVMGIFGGNDLLCVSDPVTAYNDIIDAVEKGYISEKLLNQHVERIIEMKLDYGIIE